MQAAETLPVGVLRAKAESLDNSILFDIHKDYEAMPAFDIVSTVLQAISPHLGLRLKRDLKLYKRNLKTVLVNLFVAWDNHHSTWVAYSRDSNQYKAGSRYNKLGISRVVIQIMDALRAAGLVETVNGFKDRGTGIGKTSRMRATDTLAGIFFDAALVRAFVVREVEEIVLRGPKASKRPGLALEYEDTARTKAMRRVIRRINEALRAGNITLDITIAEREALKLRLGHEIDQTRTQLQRVFNEGWDRGGRLYRHWAQELPKEFRPRLRINGNRVTEQDYGGLHIRLLYAISGQGQPDGDVYAIPVLAGASADTWRDKCKIVLQAVINAPDMENAVRGAVKGLNDKGLKTNRKEVEWMVQALKKKHEPVKQFFNSGYGSALQKTDSDMAVDILSDLLDKGIVALPIHDSFVVERQHKAALVDAMNRAFFGRFGVAPKIGEKY
ncbi:MAG TPA: hypothetical protein PKD41_02190 [Solidesulfovibrio sp.]|nr:hypothetical protein [Desulfovibrio sp.]HML59667.1 hypothetical protein [Solidesulfovibrio sp.]